MTGRVRVATSRDEAELERLIDRSTRVLLIPFLSPEELEASLELMTLDRGHLLRRRRSRRAGRLRWLGTQARVHHGARRSEQRIRTPRTRARPGPGPGDVHPPRACTQGTRTADTEDLRERCVHGEGVVARPAAAGGLAWRDLGVKVEGEVRARRGVQGPGRCRRDQARSLASFSVATIRSSGIRSRTSKAKRGPRMRSLMPNTTISVRVCFARSMT